jgi:hypothetical protein
VEEDILKSPQRSRNISEPRQVAMYLMRQTLSLSQDEIAKLFSRERTTVVHALKQIEKFLLDGASGTAYFIPIVNPDGVNISTHGSPLYKANGRGVDLNVNFDALWGKGLKNAKKKGEENYIGEKPFSEPETLALKRFTEEIAPDYTVSFHTKGEEIYWYFGQGALETARDYRIGQALSMATGYPLRLARGSVGGYKDWCISALKIPSYTVEVGADNFAHPLQGAAFMDVYQHCGGALFALSTAVRNEKINERRKIYASSNSGGEAWLETGGSAYRGGDCLRG